jgi:hypothetical protein
MRFVVERRALHLQHEQFSKEREFEMSRISLTTCFMLAVWLGEVLPAWSDQPPSETSSNILAEFSVPKWGDVILVPIPVQGESFLFLLDTGAEISAFDLRFKEGLQPSSRKAEVLAPNGRAGTKLFIPPVAMIGRIPLTFDGPVMCLDLSGVRSVTGHDIRGVLGMDFLHRQIFQWNPDQGKLVFLKKLDPADSSLGNAITVRFRGRWTPHIVGAVSNDTIGDFVIDSGASMTGILKANVFDGLASQGLLKKVGEQRLLTLVAATQSEMGRSRLLGVPGFVIQNTVVRRGDENCLGLGFWSRFVVTFDFPERRIYLRAGQRFREVDGYDLSGLHLLNVDGKIKVHSVDSGCAAESSGIQAGDILTHVNALTTEDIGLFSLRRLLCKPSDNLPVQLSRNGSELTVPQNLKSPADR